MDDAGLQEVHSWSTFGGQCFDRCVCLCILLYRSDEISRSTLIVFVVDMVLLSVVFSLSVCRTPQPDTFWVSEQIPGHHHAEDQTMVLQRGHWPSYNVPFYADIYKMSGYPEIVAKFGAKSSYQVFVCK